MGRADIGGSEEWLKLASQTGYDASRLSKKLKVSRRQLERSAHKLFGCGPQTWLNQQRLIKSAKMLKKHHPIKFVAGRLGYKQASHFSRAFKLYYGKSPSEYIASEVQTIPRDQPTPLEKKFPTIYPAMPDIDENVAQG